MVYLHSTSDKQNLFIEKLLEILKALTKCQDKKKEETVKRDEKASGEKKY